MQRYKSWLARQFGETNSERNCLINVKQKINVVWLKRDLRLQDHASFDAAERSSLPYRVVYIFEPTMCGYPDTSLRHLQFVFHSLKDMQRRLQSVDKQIITCYAEALDVFRSLCDTFDIETVWSYQESGVPWTFERDKRLHAFFRSQGVRWHEFQRDGVIRGIKNRVDWEKKWSNAIFSPPIENVYRVRPEPVWQNPFPLPALLEARWCVYPAEFQPAGETMAWKYLESFMQGRGFHYSKHISKPSESRLSCGRISPYLAWGNLSVRQAYQFSKKHVNFPKAKRAFANFQTRLIWRDHFIQKFEVECTYETHCINHGFEALTHPLREDWVQRWATGQTGYPLVDACMRCVVATGWINFRMRAMVVSFLCHHLFQDWRTGVYFLARQFLDYEPGIHFPQFQMQAGTTGVNLVRIYNPVKQSYDQDPAGVFIRKWIPELRAVPNAFIHEPWKMTAMEQAMHQFELGLDYPAPIVELSASGKFARDQIWGHRKDLAVKQESKRILAVHTKRKSESENPIRIQDQNHA